MISYWDGAVIRHSQVGLRHAKQVPDLASKRVLCQPSSPAHQHHTHAHTPCPRPSNAVATY